VGDGQLRLLGQVPARIRHKHYSIRTEQAYVAWIRGFVLRHNKPVGWTELGKSQSL